MVTHQLHQRCKQKGRYRKENGNVHSVVKMRSKATHQHWHSSSWLCLFEYGKVQANFLHRYSIKYESNIIRVRKVGDETINNISRRICSKFFYLFMKKENSIFWHDCLNTELRIEIDYTPLIGLIMIILNFWYNNIDK